MSSFLSVDLFSVLAQPWGEDFFLDSTWGFVMGALVSLACGFVGNYLILRRQAFIGDALSHTVLPGVVIAFLITQSRNPIFMFMGAVIAGIVTNVIIDGIQRYSRLKSDAAIGITFTTLFALGIALIALFADYVDLDQDCVLYGELAFIAYQTPVSFLGLSIPMPVIEMASVLLLVVLFILIFYKELLVLSFDSVLAVSLGVKTKSLHYLFMSLVALVIIAGFESVGAILVVAMLIFPGATASLLTKRLPVIFVLGAFFSVLYALLGVYAAVIFNTTTAAAMVVSALVCFLLVWVFSLLMRLIRPSKVLS